MILGIDAKKASKTKSELGRLGDFGKVKQNFSIFCPQIL